MEKDIIDNTRRISHSQYGLNQAGNSDFVRQLWLNNHFYGGIYSLQYKTEQTRNHCRRRLSPLRGKSLRRADLGFGRAWPATLALV